MFDQPIRIALHDPADVVAAVPYLLGREPAAGLVLLALARADPQRQRWQLIGVRVDDAIDGMCRTAAGGGAQAVIVVQYGTEQRELARMARQAANRHGLVLLDVLRVSGARWWSYLCPNPSCCPPEGTRRAPPTEPGGPARVAAEFVAAGLAVDPDPGGR